jgi:hypothetical protein
MTVRRGAGLALLRVVTVAVLPAWAEADVTVAYRVDSERSSGFQVGVSASNRTAAPIRDWNGFGATPGGWRCSARSCPQQPPVARGVRKEAPRRTIHRPAHRLISKPLPVTASGGHCTRALAPFTSEGYDRRRQFAGLVMPTPEHLKCASSGRER